VPTRDEAITHAALQRMPRAISEAAKEVVEALDAISERLEKIAQALESDDN